MIEHTPNLADLPPEVQALFAAQAAELGRKDAEMLGLSLTHAAEQKRLKAEMASVDAALSAERTAHAQAIQNRDTIAPATSRSQEAPFWVKVGKQRTAGAGVDP